MKQGFAGWGNVATKLQLESQSQSSKTSDRFLNDSQCASLEAIADRVQAKDGLIIADEVGMGKTRIAVAFARAVVQAGGRVAVLIPSGLGYQWREEFDKGDMTVPQVIRSFSGYLNGFKSSHAPFEQNVVIVSHTFANWRIGPNSEPFRWAILPQMLAFWKKRVWNSWPYGYIKWDSDPERSKDVRCAAKAIVDALAKGSATWEKLATIDANIHRHRIWKATLGSENYQRVSDPRHTSDKTLRRNLEAAIGLGFGSFDLVIIDEAHKARGESSGLSRLLNSIIVKNTDCRYLGMTATPVELDVDQWEQSLKRIGMSDDEWSEIDEIIKSYKKTVQDVRVNWKSAQARQEYATIAEQFENALSPYILRRDKREDSAVQHYHIKANEENADTNYRAEKRTVVRTRELDLSWRQAICAAEALSFATRGSRDLVAKRLRLTFANGHGIATMLSSQADHKEHTEQTEPDSTIETKSQSRRLQRARWWQNLLERSLKVEKQNLSTHPAIIEAVRTIEKYCEKGEKVLVFGKFTKPLYALANLLNARAMLKALGEPNKRWPQSTVVGNTPPNVNVDEWSQWKFIETACSQMRIDFNKERIATQLRQQYSLLENDRRYIRENTFQGIKEGINTLSHLGTSTQDLEELKLLLEQAEDADRQNVAKEHSRPFMSAMTHMLEGYERTELKPIVYFEAFKKLMNALRDRDMEVNAGIYDDDKMNSEEAGNLWNNLEEGLGNEYSNVDDDETRRSTSRGSTFARLLVGSVAQSTRRLLQLAFNRPHSFPQVLVAQSIVGREGLNLHEECRVVVLLHPEWNPGAVEQQIGRVDRVGSHWSKQLENSRAGELPQIEFCPIIFEETYDEHNWSVLMNRWDDLRAQLHGIVVPHRVRTDATSDELCLIDELDGNAPSFSPLSSYKRTNRSLTGS